jgi:hypothetical protein
MAAVGDSKGRTIKKDPVDVINVSWAVGKSLLSISFTDNFFRLNYNYDNTTQRWQQRGSACRR